VAPRRRQLRRQSPLLRRRHAVVGDVFDGTNWRTILVGGLGGGGRAYYALDVTDPANPISLWEISSNDDADLGLTYATR